MDGKRKLRSVAEVWVFVWREEKGRERKLLIIVEEKGKEKLITAQFQFGISCGFFMERKNK